MQLHSSISLQKLFPSARVSLSSCLRCIQLLFLAPLIRLSLKKSSPFPPNGLIRDLQPRKRSRAQLLTFLALGARASGRQGYFFMPHEKKCLALGAGRQVFARGAFDPGQRKRRVKPNHLFVFYLFFLSL